MPNLNSTSVVDRLSRVAHLFKHTFAIVGRDRDILRPWNWMTVYVVAMVLALLVGLLSSFLWVDAPGLKLVAMGAVGLAFRMFLYKYLLLQLPRSEPELARARDHLRAGPSVFGDSACPV